jgi:acid stress chaperone HdeA
MKAAIMVALGIGMGIVCAQTAIAQDKAMSPSKMTCKDFVAVDDAYRPAMVYWVAGVDKMGVRETDTMVVDTAHPVADTVVAECQKDPQARFMTKVRSLIKSGQLKLFAHH